MIVNFKRPLSIRAATNVSRYLRCKLIKFSTLSARTEIVEVLQNDFPVHKDHAYFHDLEYKVRLKELKDLAKKCRLNNDIPEVKYTSGEIATWNFVYSRFKERQQDVACREHLIGLQDLEEAGLYGSNIPSMRSVSEYLFQKTGFVLKPVEGMLNPRDFFDALSKRVFYTVIHIRHPSNPFYSPEIDLLHDMFGHVPLLANPRYANLNQALGAYSQTISEAELAALSNIYLGTVEFGLLKEDNEVKAFGAGILASLGEMSACFNTTNTQSRWLPLDFASLSSHSFSYDDHQPVYHVADSFHSLEVGFNTYARQLAPQGSKFTPLMEYTGAIQ